MKKRVISFILCIVMCFGCISVSSFAAPARNVSFEENLASSLKALGLFQGVSETNFDLSRAPSRTEALVMLIRVLGKEGEAQSGTWSHPFNDVVPWADKYVGYAYENGLTTGISDTQFGSSSTASASMYLTFVLRALGYSDAGGADFTWNNPFPLAKSLGILPSFVDTENFWRADVATVSYAALPVTIKGTKVTLASKLIDSGVFTQTQYNDYYDVGAIKRRESELASAPTVSEGSNELTAEEIYAKCSPAVFYIEVYDAKGTAFATGSGFFIDSMGTAVTNYHVIENAYSAVIITSDNQYEYEVAGVYDYSAEEDWAIIKIEGTGFPYLSFGSESTIIGGAPVYAIGSPLGLDNTISTGLISNPSRATTTGLNLIQISTPISHGSSGGALINKYGEVIGITSSGIDEGQNINFAIPLSYIKNYSAASVTPLSTLFYNPAANTNTGTNTNTGVSQSDRQSAAFYALKSWILENANSTLSGEPAYYESSYDSSGVRRHSYISYSAEYDTIYLVVGLAVDNSMAMSEVLLSPSGNSPLFSYGFISDLRYSDKPSFTGYGSLYAPTFSENSVITFSDTEGFVTPAELSDHKTLAVVTLVLALQYGDYVLDSYIDGYSLYDFGFKYI